MKRIVPAIVTAVAAATCGGSNSPPAPGTPGSSPGPSTSSQRLAWTQGAPTQADLQNYDFILFVDLTRTTLPAPTCTGTAPLFECTTALPQLAAGRHVLELSAVDRATGLESAHSTQLVVGQSAGAADNSTASADQPARLGVERSEGRASTLDAFSVSCAGSSSPACFDVSVVADDVGAVERLVSLPDGRLLAVYGGGIVRILPDGLAERLQLDRSGDAAVADLAVDPDFLVNRFVYFATTARGADGLSTVSVVRMREVSGRLGEAATVAASLPAGGAGSPAISIGSDEHIYIALPSIDGGRPAGAAYDGLVLRLTREGSAAGYERMNSPVLAFGSPRPSSLGWLGEGRLILASSSGTGTTALGMVRPGPGETWPAPITPLPLPDASRFADGIKRVAADSRAGASSLESRLYILGVEPSVLYVARLTTAGTAAAVASIDAIPLGQLLPVTFALADDGSLLVAARQGTDPRVRLLRLQARQ